MKTVPLRSVVAIDRDQRQWDDRSYVGLEDIETGTGRLLSNGQITAVKSTTFGFDERHVLYGRLRPYLNKVLLPDFRGHSSTEIIPLLPSDAIDRSYLWYWLTATETVEVIDSTCTGARMPRANMDRVLDLHIPVGPLAEQRRIVAVLDEAFAAIATATANAQKNLANARELLLGYLDSVLRKSSLGPGSLEAWETIPLGGLCQILDRMRKPITKSDRRPGANPYYGATGIVDFVDGFIFDEKLVLLGEDGAKWGPGERSAFTASGKYWVNNHAHIMRPNRQILRDEWLIYYLNMTDLMPYVTGVTVPKLNQERMRSIPVPLPPLEIQDQLIEKMDGLAEEINSLSALNERKLEGLSMLKQSLLATAFSGELVGRVALAA